MMEPKLKPKVYGFNPVSLRDMRTLRAMSAALLALWGVEMPRPRFVSWLRKRHFHSSPPRGAELAFQARVPAFSVPSCIQSRSSSQSFPLCTIGSRPGSATNPLQR